MSALDSVEHTVPRRSRLPSTASIRSTASTRSPRPTVWRQAPASLRIRRDSLSTAPDAKISCVVAGAEISASNNGSVRERMEAYNVAPGPVAGPSSPAPSSTSELPREIAMIPEVETDGSGVVEGTNVVAFPVSASPTPSRSSWFGSLSRAKGKEKLSEVQATASEPNLLAPASIMPQDAVPDDAVISASEPVTSFNPAAPERPDPLLSSTSTQPIAVQKAAAAKRSWFSSSPSQPSPLRASSPPQPIPQSIYIPSTTLPEDQASIPSSIDSSVPLPVATPPADITVSFPLPEDATGTVRGRQRLASLNPGVGRFGINLPLVGGSRAAATNGTSFEGINDNATGTTTTTGSTGASELLVQDSMTEVHTTTLQTTTTSTTVDSSNISAQTKTEVKVGRQSTWWDYVGWSSAPPDPVTESKEEQGDATPKPPPQATLVEQLPELENLPSPDDVNMPSPTMVPSPLPMSHVQEISSWYSPWYWYGSTSSVAAGPLVASEGNSAEKPAETQLIKTTEPQEPEPVVEETAPADTPSIPAADSARTAAQQRYWTSFFSSSYSHPAESSSRPKDSDGTIESSQSTPAANISAPPSDASASSTTVIPQTSSLSLGSNPIGDSISTQSTGWVSFFNSGTLGYVSRKPVTSGEPEVMEIDTDDMPDEREATDVAAASPAVPRNEPAPQSTKASDAQQSRGRDATKADDAKESKTKPSKCDEPPKAPDAKNSDAKPSKGEDPPPTKGSGGAPSTKPSTKLAAPPLTISESVKRQVANNSSATTPKRSASPAPSVGSRHSTGTKSPSKAPSIAAPRTPTPNLVLPTWGDTFHTPPRSIIPQRLLDTPGRTVGRAVVEKTVRFVSGVLFASDRPQSRRRTSASSGKGKSAERETEQKERDKRYEEWGLGLPRAWDVLKPAAGKARGGEDEGDVQDVLRGAKRVVVIGVHGWFPGTLVKSMLGEPTGTSTKFVNMMVSALEEFQGAYNVTLEKITQIPLEGEGTISHRAEKLYTALTSNSEWMDDLHAADVIFVATHSQGSIVSTHILDRLIRDGHIRTGGPDFSGDPGSPATSAPASLPPPPPQRVCCLAMCGIHLGPLRYLNSSSLLLPYIQYFESAAAKELFEFQNTESEVSKSYVKALENVLDSGTKMVYVASLNDQVVPIYSGLFTSASHPLILRALYIDGDAYHSSDFLSNLLVLLIRVLNAGLPDSGLVNHLSEATAGSLNGVGHSTPYEEIANYSLAVKYLFLTNSGFDTHPKLTVESFNANTEQNDYEIPWSLRDIIADERIAHFFSKEIHQLASAFRHWSPKTTILREIKRKLQPIQRLPPSFAATTNSTSASKL